ncbi:MAG: alpha/beta hydrolase [Pseudomonadota bacterium]
MTPLDEWRSAAKFVTLGKYQFAYWTSGDTSEQSPTLLLIHGFPTSSWDWSALWPHLQTDFHVVALDMLGFGLSDKPANHRYSLFEQADFQEAVMEHLGLSEAHILAHDYGDTVAQELIARQNEHQLSFSIKSAVFLNGGLLPSEHRPLLIQKLAASPLGALVSAVFTRDKLKASFDEIFGPETKASDGEIAAHWKLITENGGRRVMHRLMQYIPERRRHGERWVAALKDTIIPLRIIIGAEDPISGSHLFKAYQKELPGSDGVLLENIGHYPHTEAPQRVLDAFEAFHHKHKITR